MFEYLRCWFHKMVRLGVGYQDIVFLKVETLAWSVCKYGFDQFFWYGLKVEVICF